MPHDARRDVSLAPARDRDALSRAARTARALASVLLTGVLAGAFLVLLESAVAEPDPRRATGELQLPGADDVDAAVAVLPSIGPTALPYGGQLDLPDPDDIVEPGALLGLGLLVLGLANGLVFVGAAALDGMVAPSPAETRRRLRSRSSRGVVPGGWREVERTVPARPAAPAASDGPALADAPALRSVPGPPAAGTTYAPFPRPGIAWCPAPARPASPSSPQLLAPDPVPEDEPVTQHDPVTRHAPASEPVSEPVGPVVRPRGRRPSPVPRDGGDGPSRATRRGSGPWGWRPARPDPVPWRNPLPALAT